MKHIILLSIVLSLISIVLIAGCTQQNQNIEASELKLDNVTIKWLGHSGFLITDSDVIYIDPFVLPENATAADFVLATHDHYDHCAVDSIKKLQKNDTRIIGTMDCIIKFTGKINSMTPNEYFLYPNGLRIDSIEAYNINKSYHPKNFGLGFVITIDGKKIYHAGDTDNIPEMSKLKNLSIDVALLPIGGTQTMNMEEAAEAAKIINPKFVIPMHYNSGKYGINGLDADPQKLKELLKDTNIKVVILKPVA